jgi:hypothetical protein
MEIAGAPGWIGAGLWGRLGDVFWAPAMVAGIASKAASANADAVLRGGMAVSFVMADLWATAGGGHGSGAAAVRPGFRLPEFGELNRESSPPHLWAGRRIQLEGTPCASIMTSSSVS